MQGRAFSGIRFSLWGFGLARTKPRRLKPTLLKANVAEILHLIGNGKRESVGNNSEFYGETPGGLSVHLDLDMRFRIRGAL
jgi:hypothetical protein